MNVLTAALESPGTPIIALVVVAAQVASAISILAYLIYTHKEH